MLTHGMPCVTHMACHVSHMHAFAMHCDTWLAMCHHMVGHVSSTWLAMCRPTRIYSKYVKFRLSRNSTKFDWVANFHETILTVQSVLSSEIYKKIPTFLWTIPVNYRFAPFLSENFKFKIFTGFTLSPP